MSKHTQDDFYERLIDEVSREINRDKISRNRNALMAFIAEGAGENCTAVLLWMRDRDGHPTLRLSNVYYHDQNNIERPEELLNISIAWPAYSAYSAIKNKTEANQAEILFPQIPQEINNKISDWHSHIGLGSIHGNKFELIAYTEESDTTAESVKKHIFGYTQLLFNEPPPPTLSSKFNKACQALAVRIFSGREMRILRATSDLPKTLWNKESSDEILKETAKILLNFTRAQMCVIYRPEEAGDNSGLQVKSLAVDARISTNDHDIPSLVLASDSLHAHIFKQKHIVRIKDIADSNEVAIRLPLVERTLNDNLLKRLDAVLEPDSLNNHTAAHSRLFASVQVPKVGGDTTSIALIEVLYKRNPQYLHDQFSITDEKIIQNACKHVASTLPTTEIMVATNSISIELANARFDEPGSQAQIVIAQILLENLKKWVIGVEAVSFVFDNLSSASACTYPSNLGDWDKQLMQKKEELGKLIKLPDSERWHYMANPSANADGKSGRLMVRLKTDSLPNYQAQIIERAATSVWLTAYEVAAYDHANKYLIESRHAIRSGIQGVIGHVSTVQGLYDLVAKENDPNFSHKKLITNAAFRKSLKAGYLAAYQTQTLLEEARLIHTGIQPATLQIGGHNLPSLLRDVRRLILPEAEQRELDINLENQKEQHTASFDSKAMMIVFYNILDNAIKYAARGTTIRIRSWADGRFWYVSFQDDGVYIAPDSHEAIFQPYTRVSTHDPAARQGISTRPGSGLGMSISRKIIRAHSILADLTVESIWLDEKAKRAQTTFIIKMPHQLT